MDEELRNNLIDFIFEVAEENQYDEDQVREFNDRELINFVISTDSHDPRVEDYRTPLVSGLIRTNNHDLALRVLRLPEIEIDVRAADTNGQTPLDYAHQRGAPLLIETIQNLLGDNLPDNNEDHQELVGDTSSEEEIIDN